MRIKFQDNIGDLNLWMYKSKVDNELKKMSK